MAKTVTAIAILSAVTAAMVPDEPAPEHVWDRIQGAIATTGPAGSDRIAETSARQFWQM